MKHTASASSAKPDRLTDAGWPRPVNGGLPIPWVSPPDDLSSMSPARAAACASGAVCAVCGLGYQNDEEAFALVLGDEHPTDMADVNVQAMDNAIMHRRCLRLALAKCPRLRSLRAGGNLTVVRTVGNAAEITIDEDGAVKALLAGGDCEIIDLEALNNAAHG